MEAEQDAPEVDLEELSRYIADRTGIPAEVVARVLEAETEYLVERGISPRRSSNGAEHEPPGFTSAHRVPGPKVLLGPGRHGEGRRQVHSRSSNRNHPRMESGVDQSRVIMRAPRIRRMSAMPPVVRAVVFVAVVVLGGAGCSGGDRGNREAAIPDAQLLPAGPSGTIEAHVRARPWASSKVNGQAWGRIWLEKTRSPQDRDGRGEDAYRWAIRACDAVRNGGQTPQAMVRRVRDEGRFTAQGAKVIVTAALGALCPERTVLSQLPP
jgi:hypothetical protein